MVKLQPPVPFFEAEDADTYLGTLWRPDERRFVSALKEHGGAVIDLGWVGRRLCDRIVAETDRYFDDGKTARVQDAWLESPAIRRMSRLPKIVRLLKRAYGRNPFPFQTLNFLQGSQQHLHSDTIHFSSMPERFMCGVWIALEDVQEDAGPLIYKPGSHSTPILKMSDVGVNHSQRGVEEYDRYYVPRFAQIMEDSALPTRPAIIRKGQAFVWAANLAHGGAPIRNPASTRRSLVVHYFFEDCTYYTPMFSDEDRGAIFLREPYDVSATPRSWRWPLRNGSWVGFHWRSPMAQKALDAWGEAKPILN